MPSIREYLEQGRAGKTFDPTTQQYVDPTTGQAFTPTFTNIPKGYRAPGFEDAHYMEEGIKYAPEMGRLYRQDPSFAQQPQPGAIQPEQAGMQMRRDTEGDPWDKAMQLTTESLPEIHAAVLPGKRVDEALTPDEKKKLKQAMQAHFMAGVERYQYFDKQKGSQRGAQKPTTQKDYLDLYNKVAKEPQFQYLNPQDPATTQAIQGEVQRRLQWAQEQTGQAQPGGGRAIGVPQGQGPAMPAPTAPQGQQGFQMPPMGGYQGQMGAAPLTAQQRLTTEAQEFKKANPGATFEQFLQYKMSQLR